MGFLSNIKKVAKKVGRAVAGAVTHVINTALEILNRIIGIPGFLIDLIIPWPRKKLRLRIKILIQEDGSPLHPTRDIEIECKEAYELADKILRESANVKLVTYGSLPRVKIIDDIPPTEALYPRCDGGAFKDHYQEAGLFYINNKQYSVTFLIGAGAPITAFIVMDIKNNDGCSLGPLTDYVIVDVDGLITDSEDDAVPTTTSNVLAHEIGHACGLGLKHSKKKSNLMYRTVIGRGTSLKRYQKAIFRNSRHVTYL